MMTQTSYDSISNEKPCLMRTNLFVWAQITNCLFLHVQSNVPEYALAIEENYEIFNLVFPFTYTLHMKCLISQKYFFLLIHMKYINTTVKLLLFWRCRWTQIYLPLFTVIVKEAATTLKVFITCNRQDFQYNKCTWNNSETLTLDE